VRASLFFVPMPFVVGAIVLALLPSMCLPMRIVG